MFYINRTGNFKCECGRTFGAKRSLTHHLKSEIHKDLMAGMPDFTTLLEESVWQTQKRAERMSREEGMPVNECLKIVQKNIKERDDRLNKEMDEGLKKQYQ